MMGHEEILFPLPEGTELEKGRIGGCIKRTALGFVYRFYDGEGMLWELLEFCPAGLGLCRRERALQIPLSAQPSFCRGLSAFYRIGAGLLEARGSRNLPEAAALFEEHGTAYVRLRPPAGEPLSQLQGRLSAEALLELAEDLSDGLVIAHSLGLVHGDIRRSRIRIEPSGNGRLTGFFAPCLHSLKNRPLPEMTVDLCLLGESLYEAFAGRPVPRNREGLLLPVQLCSTWERLLSAGTRRGFSSVLEFKHALNGLCRTAYAEGENGGPVRE